jgi:hypothetical protein
MLVIVLTFGTAIVGCTGKNPDGQKLPVTNIGDKAWSLPCGKILFIIGTYKG